MSGADSNATCIACRPGSSGPHHGSDKCASCAPGKYQSAEGATACGQCVPGSYCPLGSAAPLPCIGGTWSNSTNLTSAGECTEADAGYFSPTGSSQQTACRPNTFNPHVGQSSDAACMSCSLNSSTDGQDGQTSVSACKCLPSFYEQNSTSKWDTASVDCHPCVDLHQTWTIKMTNCSAAGATLDRIPLMRGFWRQSAASRIVRACNDKSFCVGGDEPGDASCALGHAGPFCDRKPCRSNSCWRRACFDGPLPACVLQYVCGSLLCTTEDAATSASLA